MQAPDNKDEAKVPTKPEASDRDDGVDITLIRWTLSLSAPERLALLQRQANSLAKLRDAYASS